MRAEEFITNILGMRIERPHKTASDGLSLGLRKITYPDGRTQVSFVVPDRVDLNTRENQRALWHEIGHLFDNANFRGGRGKSSFNAYVTTGVYASDNWKLLKKYQNVLQKNREAPILELTIPNKVKGKRRTILRSIEDIDNLDETEYSEARKQILRNRFRGAKMNMNMYLSQDIELFADGFAEFALNPRAFVGYPELDALYRSVFEGNPTLHVLLGRVKPTTIINRNPKKKPSMKNISSTIGRTR